MDILPLIPIFSCFDWLGAAEKNNWLGNLSDLITGKIIEVNNPIKGTYVWEE